jgi:hypothetical protein
MRNLHTDALRGLHAVDPLVGGEFEGFVIYVNSRHSTPQSSISYEFVSRKVAKVERQEKIV